MAPHCVILVENALEALEKVGMVINSIVKAQGSYFLGEAEDF